MELEHGTTDAARLLAALERRMFVTPTLRRVVEALPARPSAGSPQVDAVAGLVVLNAWICLGEAALDLLRELDAATGEALHLFPRDLTLAIRAQDDAELARAETVALATKLGFSPGHRTKVALVVQDCARTVAATGGGRLELRVVLAAPRGLVAVATLGPGAARRGDDVRVGSAPWLSPRHVRHIADEFEVDEAAPGGAARIRAAFHIGGRGAVA
ncbi:MAG: hypothetical protein M9894_08165 [Planctomycetes bacterium]|nr:hypothetical protein [Planctomycetota bacterium]